MKSKLTLILVALQMGLLVSQALAHPTSYQDSLAVMTWNQPDQNDLWVVYSFRYDKALAARHMRVQTRSGLSKMNMGQFNWLVKRWNQKNSQANVYLYGGFGSHEHLGQSGTVGVWGLEADAESRKLFIWGRGEGMRSSHNQDFELYEFRLGAAPYEAEFNEIASWLMLQYQYRPQMVSKEVLTPLVRFFYRNVLWEMGSSFDGDFMLNFMVHF
ncbi:MAG: hypothetical protein AB7N80_13455 [Bdellovibrionales bacterium]